MQLATLCRGENGYPEVPSDSDCDVESCVFVTLDHQGVTTLVNDHVRKRSPWRREIRQDVVGDLLQSRNRSRIVTREVAIRDLQPSTR